MAVGVSWAEQAAGPCAAVVQGPQEVGEHLALAVAEGSAPDEMAPWGPLSVVGASRELVGPSHGVEVGALLRAPPLSIWKVERNTVKNFRLEGSATAPV